MTVNALENDLGMMKTQIDVICVQQQLVYTSINSMGHKIAMLRKQLHRSQNRLPQHEVNSAFEKLLGKKLKTPKPEVKRQAQTESLSSDHRDIDDESNLTEVAAVLDKKTTTKKVQAAKDKTARLAVTKCAHTDAKYHCKGMCKPCYTRSMNKNLKERKLHKLVEAANDIAGYQTDITESKNNIVVTPLAKNKKSEKEKKNKKLATACPHTDKSCFALGMCSKCYFQHRNEVKNMKKQNEPTEE